MSDSDYESGLAIRRAVLGDAYVDQSLTKDDLFNEPMQRFATEAYWSKVWGRGVLPRRDASLAVLGMLLGLNRPDDLALHLRAAMRNGLSLEEIREVLLLSTVYCGAPAAHGAFRVANTCLQEAIEQLKQELPAEQ